jgi:hypothetical protein
MMRGRDFRSLVWATIAGFATCGATLAPTAFAGTAVFAALMSILCALREKP